MSIHSNQTAPHAPASTGPDQAIPPSRASRGYSVSTIARMPKSRKHRRQLRPGWIFYGLIFTLLFAGIVFGADKEDGVRYNELTAEEMRIIIDKGTEPPFSGEYWDHKEDGTYACKRCGVPLYRSADKFDSHCGWPSFDDEIPGAVKRVPDADGVRTEITCAKCGAHLGHVFQGEGFTEKNVRHCVNSMSLDFVAEQLEPAVQKAYFAGGCFWGVEHYLQQIEGVISTQVGYMGGRTENPSYRDVCDGNSGHAEAVEVVFDANKTSYEDIAKMFFEIHDPTQIDRQGPDIGEQYRSAVFYVDDEQKRTVEKLIEILESKGYRVATELSRADAFWKAEEYHQDYYSKTGKQPYCHIRTERF